MRIESLRLKNFKVFQDVEISELPPLCVFVGANGSGKTTLFDVFGFLKHALLNNVRSALQARGGYKEVVSRGHEDEDITIEIKFRMPIVGVDRLVTYYLCIGDPSKPRVKREILRYKRGAHGSPYHFLDFADGKGYAITNEEDFNKTEEDLTRERHELGSPDILAIKGLGQFTQFKAASAFRHLIENWHVSDFHISDARGSKDAAGYSEHLSATGDNLQLVAQHIHENHSQVFGEIVERMKRRVPGIVDVVPEPTLDGKLLLKFKDGSFKDPFVDRFVSDGTIKMFAYLVLLYDPAAHPLLCVEEPENQLYPTLLEELIEEFRLYAGRGGQVMVSTHSPDFLNGARLEEVFWLAKQGGFTKIRRAGDDPQVAAYMADGDQMGYLWKQGFLEGASVE
jgi:predicted ATPase